MPFSDARHSWTWELVEASKSWLPILLLVVYINWNLTYTTRQGSRVSYLAQTGFAAFSKGVQLISGSPYAEIESLTSSHVQLWREPEKGIQWVPRGKQRLPHNCLNSNLLLFILRWQVYRLARLIGKFVRFQHRGTHWCAAPLYQKQRNRSGLNNWLDCLASWYTSNSNLCRLLRMLFFLFSFTQRPNRNCCGLQMAIIIC